tara:strand:+ start:3054 stop:3299 length:246 start_codon:yes stop_codon:yes gene_type:complete
VTAIGKFMDTMNAIEKEMEEKNVDLLVMDEVKLTIDAREVTDENGIKDIIDEICMSFAGEFDRGYIFKCLKEDEDVTIDAA